MTNGPTKLLQISIDRKSWNLLQMVKRPKNYHVAWTAEHIDDLKRMATEGLPTRYIAKKLGRTEVGVKSKALELGIALRPPGKRRFGAS